MKIAFIVPINADNAHKQHYATIINILLNSGHNVIHSLYVSDEILSVWNKEKREALSNSYKAQIGNCDLAIAECTVPSVQVGYEISNAITHGKDVIILKSKDTENISLTSSLQSLHKNIYVYDYTSDSLILTIKEALEFSRCQKYKKYNVIFPTDLVNKLDIISKKKNLPKSVYIRQLLEKGLSTEDFG